MPPQQLPGALHRVTDVEQPANQRLNPAECPPLVISEAVRQRLPPQFSFQPRPLGRRQPLSRHRPLRLQRHKAALSLSPPPAPYRSRCDPQVPRDRTSAVPRREPISGLQP